MQPDARRGAFSLVVALLVVAALFASAYRSTPIFERGDAHHAAAPGRG
ncbi:MAG: hypothetical protein ACYDGR_01400 [Candidatus Dormibacteria bacterium]